MAFLLRRVTVLRSIVNSHLLSQSCKYSYSRDSTFHDRVNSVSDRFHLSPLFSENSKDDIKDCKIEIVDDATWHVSSGLADAWRANDENKSSQNEPEFSDREDDGYDGNWLVGSMNANKENPDFDEIEDMRIHGKLFYKLDKDSREYEEYKFDFHRKKSSRNEKNPRERKENKKKENPSPTLAETTPRIKKNKELKTELLSGFEKNKNLIMSRLHELGVAKKQRTLTFNQQTAPYHEPFCLDVFISKGSVRASIIHRATSNVVVVSHSISKDMKFDLGSVKNRSACAAVGEVLAQRALADDIHNVVYTPRKGDRLEGKIQIVLNSIVDGGVDVKVKLKQKKMGRKRSIVPRNEDQC